MLLLIFHITNKDLLSAIKQYDIKQIVLSKDSVEYIHNIIENLKNAITNSKYTNYIVINRDILKNIIQNIISISNRVVNNELQIADIYLILNYIWEGSFTLSPFSYELSVLVDKQRPDINDAKIFINNLVFNHYRRLDINQTIFQLSHILKDNNQIIENIHGLEDIPNIEDVFLDASIFEVLSNKVQREMIAYFKENIKELYYLLMLHESYHIPILDKKILKELLETPCFEKSNYKDTEEISSLILSRIRKNSEYSIMYDIIDDFAKQNICFQFFLDPLNFSDLDTIQPTWVCHCEDSIIQKLLENRIIREKVKEYVTNDTFGKLVFDRIWKLL